jgi:hypothetical protein
VIEFPHSYTLFFRIARYGRELRGGPENRGRTGRVWGWGAIENLKFSAIQFNDAKIDRLCLPRYFGCAAKKVNTGEEGGNLRKTIDLASLSIKNSAKSEST